MAALRPGDWNCPSCDNHNYANRVNCNRCQTPKPGGAGGMGAVPQMGGGYGGIKSENGAANRFSPYGITPGVSNGGAKAGAAGAARPGDWTCPSCANVNYASRTNCNKCGVPRQGLGGMQMGGMAPGMAAMMGYGAGVPQGMMLVPAGQAMQMGGQQQQQQQQMRPGDWLCRACNNVNYASRESCNKCDMAKGIYIAKTGLRTGDWICTACGNHNFADKACCNKCQGPKTESSVSKKGLRAGDWMCAMCGNHNFANRETCNKCQSPKPQGAGMGAQQAPAWSQPKMAATF